MTQQQLLEALVFIAMHKDMLPVRLRGWVNVLGLYVRERKAGQWARLQAGGKFRSYLDAWRETGAQWDIKRFDSDTWDRRFSQVVEPTSQIAEFLVDHVEADGTLDAETAGMLVLVTQHYEATREWLGLPYYGESVSEEETNRRLVQRTESYIRRISDQAKDRRREERLQRISENEVRVRADPQASPIWWRTLAEDYEEEGRFKEMESALVREVESSSGPRYSHMYLGKAYLAAMSNTMRGKGLPIWGFSPSAVTAESLGYTTEMLQSLAVTNLSKIELRTEDSFVEEMKLALNVAEAPSDQTFGEYDRWMAKQAAEVEEAIKGPRPSNERPLK